MRLSPRNRRLRDRVIWIALAMPAVYQLLLVAVVIAGRIAYPYDLEWMEGGLLDHARRVQAGEGLYVEPSIDFIPYLYTPLYPGLMALLGHVFGLSYALGRAISVIALLCAAATIITIGLDQSERPGRRASSVACGVLGAGLIGAAYPWIEGWYDLVRGDTLFAAMIIGGLALLWRWRDARGRRGHLRIGAVAALLALSYFCKQGGVFFVAAGGANLLLWRRWRLIPTYVIVAGLIGVGGTWALERLSGGWYWIYAYDLFQTHDFNYPRFYGGFKEMLGRSIVATTVIGVALACTLIRVAARAELPASAVRFLFWLVPYATAIVVGALTWGHQWSHFNAFIPAIFVGAAATATALIALVDLSRAWFSRAGFLFGVLFPLALAVQLLSQAWRVSPFIPAAADAAAGARLVERIRAIEGDVFMPYHPWYLHLAGKPTHAHRMGLMDVQYGNRFQVAGMREAFRDQRFAVAIIDNRPLSWIHGLSSSYRIDDVIPPSERPRVFGGGRVVPATLWIPIGPPPAPPPGARVLFDFDFEKGYGGWTARGTAWGKEPSSGSGPNGAYHYTGNRYARSSTGGNAATGTLESPPFTIEGSAISGRIGGSVSASNAAELWVEGVRVRTARGSGSARLETVRWKVDDLRGKRATIVLADRDPRGFLSADAFWMWD